jgi:hypothetical protein
MNGCESCHDLEECTATAYAAQPNHKVILVDIAFLAVHLRRAISFRRVVADKLVRFSLHSFNS